MPAPAQSASSTSAGLLSWAASIPDFAALAGIPAGQWSAASQPCAAGNTSNWQYIVCEDGVATGLEIYDVLLSGASAILTLYVSLDKPHS